MVAENNTEIPSHVPDFLLVINVYHVSHVDCRNYFHTALFMKMGQAEVKAEDKNSFEKKTIKDT
jgi:hypothetical protein